MRVHALHVGPGLPKPAVPSLEVTSNGVVGDVNRYRKRRGGDPDMAVSLLALEIVLAVAPMWPEMVAGALGENVTTVGVRHEELAAGQVWRIGPAVVQLSRRMEPCRTLTALVGPSRLHAFQKALVGRRGWYARVIEPGTIGLGDAIRST